MKHVHQFVDFDPNATGRRLAVYKQAAGRTGCTLEEWKAKRSAGFRWCFRCRSWKKSADFSRDSSRPGGATSSCRACCSKASTASRYKTTVAKLAAMARSQDGRCAICGNISVLVVDHHHGTGAVRSLLCSRCNVGLGMFGDNPTTLQNALAYLEKHNGN